MVAEAIIKDKMSYREAAKPFEVSNHHLVADWERIYLMLYLLINQRITF